jgi:dolichyl-phosphate beta-glucosyltransferase
MADIKKKEDIYLSIIISFYNEGSRIEKTLKDIEKFTASQPYECQVVLSDDQSTDHSIDIAKKYSEEIEHFEYLEPKAGQPKGKGAGIQRGIMASVGKYIMFMDADSSTPIEEVDKLLPFVDKYDIVMGSRYIREPRPYKSNYFGAVLHGIKSVIEVLLFGHSKDYEAKGKQGRLRQLISRGGNLVFTVFLNQSYVDQRCGFKLYRKKAAKLLSQLQTVPTFGFDTEYLSIAQKFKLKSIEVPVEWYDDGASKVDPVKDTIKSFTEMFMVMGNLIRGKYSKKNAKKKLGEMYDEYILNWD